MSNIKGHDQSRRHAKCVEAQKAREALTSTPICLGLRNLNAMTEEKLVKLFNTAYYIAKNERPFSDFNQLCMLQVKNGVTLGETYLNDKRCREFFEAIAEIMELEARDEMNNSQPCFFS